MSIWQKVQAVWEKVGIVQRVLLVAIVLTFVMVGASVTYWVRRPDMRMLYAELDPQEAAKITDKISEKGIAYELRGGGTSIYVPKEKVYQLRLDMAKEGLAGSEQGGYRIFDNEKIGVSPFIQNVNLKRALQEELAKSIQMIDGVLYARVHIVRPEKVVFTASQPETSASVVLKIRAGYRLSGENIAAITNLVAGGIEGLKSENVTVIDSQGRLLAGTGQNTTANGAGTVQDYKERVEQTLAKKVEDMLTLVLGPGRATVKVSAEVDMTSSQVMTEKYDSAGKVPSKEEITSNSETQPVAGGEAAGAATPGVKKDESTVTEYLVGKTVEQRTDLPGDVKSISVAAVVDLSPGDANQAAGGKNAKIMQIADVETLIQNALGLDIKGGDSLKVVEAHFNRPVDVAQTEGKGGLDIIAIVRDGSLGITAICALLVLKIFRGARKKATAALPAGEPGGAIGSAGLLPAASQPGSETVVVRRQIAQALRNNPEQARQLFLSWLQEKNA